MVIGRCPLCGSRKTRLEEVIEWRVLGGLYEQLLPGFDMSSLVVGPELEYRICSVCRLGFFFPALEGSPDFYDALSMKSWYYQQEKPEYEIARRYIREDDRVVDVGCGSGEFATHIPLASYIGIEPNERAVTKAILLGRDVILGSFESFFENRSDAFDVVCCFQILEHVANPGRFFKLIGNFIRDGGLLIVSVPNAESFLALESNQPLNYPPHHLTWWTASVLEKMADIFGYRVVTIEYDVLTERFARRYSTELILEALRRILRRNRRMVGESHVDRVFRRGASQLGRFLAIAVKDGKFGGHGHSVTAVLRRRNT